MTRALLLLVVWLGVAASASAQVTLQKPASGGTPDVGSATGVLAGANGGTGIANTGKTFTLGGNVTTSGSFNLTFTLTGTTSVTLPTSGTLATTAGNVATATALQTARAINGVSFDGTAPITVTAAAGTLSGNTLASGVTASSLTSFGNSPTFVTPTIAKLANLTSNGFVKTSGGDGTLSVDTASYGDFSSNTGTSVDGEMVLFSGTGGKTAKRSTLTGGLLLSTSGVPSVYGGAGATTGSYVTAISAAGATTVSNLGIPKIVVKSANESVISSAAPQNDDHLTFAIGSSEVWAVDAVIFYDSNTAADIRFTWSVPSGATWIASATGIQCSGTSTVGSFDSYTATSGDFCIGGAAVGTKQLARLVGLFTNSTTAGSVTLQWAQWTSNGNNSTVNANSYLVAKRVQ